MTIYPSLSALESFSLIQEVSANNLANINTNEFKASRADLETGPQDQGVVVSQIIEDNSPGALIPEISLKEENSQVEQELTYVESSNTDLIQELTTELITETNFSANAKVLQTYDSMVGTLLDLFA
ncbi:MAG: hypothetical protein PWR24_2088 [Desulfonauticus sp.]|nr:hypothetical protein [Desulfonauticus sp.]